MKLLLVIDSHIFKTEDGRYWCKGITDRAFFDRYLNVFEKIKIVSRIKKVSDIDETKFLRVDSDGIEFVDIPFVRSAKEYILNYKVILRMFSGATKDCDCAIFRLPSFLSFITYNNYKRTKKTYAIEIVADVEGAYKGNKLLEIFLKHKLKKIAKDANGVSYVTEKFLQEKYPSGIINNKEKEERFESFYSSIDLKDEFFSKEKVYENKKSEYIIAHTANTSASMVKGQDTLIKALGILRKDGYNVRVLFIGDSEIKEKYYQIAEEGKVKDYIKFTGIIVDKSELKDMLIKADLFVLPTRAEGLPRSVIEAMALGLPCISTPISGIPELLPNKCMIDPDDYEKFAKVIEYYIDNPVELTKLSKRNIEKAKEYRYETLSRRRTIFYKKLRTLAEKSN